MKEFTSQKGGRPTYVDDIINLQDIALAVSYTHLSVVKNTVGVDWIEEWDGTHSQIGENYVITPKLFAGHKPNEGKITGV